MQTAQPVAQTQQSSTGTMFMPTMPGFVSNGTPSNNAGNSNNNQPSFFGAASPIGGVNNMGDIMQQMLKESSSDAQMLDF